MRSLRLSVSVFLLALLSAPALGIVNYDSYWYWMWGTDEYLYGGTQLGYEYLTGNSGAHAVSMTKWASPESAWVNVVTHNDSPSVGIKAVAHQYRELGPDGLHFDDIATIRRDADYYNVCVAAAADGWQGRKVVTFCEDEDDDPVHASAADLSAQIEPWPDHKVLSDAGYGNDDLVSAVVLEDRYYGCAVFPADRDALPNRYHGLMGAQTANGGSSWGSAYWIISEVLNGPRICDPSICKGADEGELHLAYVAATGENVHDTIKYRQGSNHGAPGDWGTPVVLDHYDKASQPCIASLGDTVVVCWTRTWGSESRIYYTWSTNGGGSWPNGVNEVPLEYSDANGPIKYSRPNISMVSTFGRPTVVMVCAVDKVRSDPTRRRSSVAAAYGKYWSSHNPPTMFWSRSPWLTTGSTWNDYLYCPSVATLAPWRDYTVPQGIAVWSRPLGPAPEQHRYLYDSRGKWGFWSSWGTADGANPGRNVAVDAAGNVHYASLMKPYVIGGPIDGAALTPIMQDVGSQPALALDGDGSRWTSYLRNDTVWCIKSEDGPTAVFAGSSSAVPGQPSIVCYPTQGGETAANVVFAVYDTAGGASTIMYARVNIDGVVLDTIESVNTLRDSLPCINVYLSDSLVVTYQHGDSILSRLLANYGPLTEGQPPAWSNANLVTASGYHSMSVMEDGSVLNCVWTSEDDGDLAIERATNSLGGGMFGNWIAMTAPSAGSNVEKGNPVYAGVGASVWQQLVSGKWAIKGYVRGAETTLVANDTDAYHPHAVAESSAVSPSIDRIELSLLYDAGVAFEVDSGVHDTGEVRFSQFNFNVSNAGSDATKANNGTKLMRKEGCDSLFAAYQDADGSVMYAYSAAGDSWRREVLATERSYPAIAADSTGKHWVVARTADGSMPAAQYLYYQSGGSWASQSLYSSWDLLGPASLGGASSTTTGIAYAAFRVNGITSKYIVLTKFNGTTVAACTLATGANLGDPSIAVEAYKTDSDRVHVTWEDAGVVKYRMNTDGRSSGIANKWTSVVSLSDAQATSHHPSINCDRDQIVAAWAQGATAEIYCRKRLTSSAYNSWDAAVNLSNTANNASDWPTIAMGDTVVVAWEETRSANDHDILACIDFGDTLNVADNATVSGYPHVIFQNKASGDTAIPYLHTIFSETPSANYYEVGYNKLNLKQSSGEGQQSASSIPIPTKPVLTSCSPNPFRDRTQIRYALPTEGNVSLRVYDATGRTVRTLASGHQKAGSYSATWDSRDNRGRQVPRGVYFYRLDTPGFRSVKKAVVTR